MTAHEPMQIQVGGNHYKSLVIQPAEFWIRNQMPATEGAIVKYLTRHRSKNGRQDCEKAAHFAQMLRWWYFDAPTDRATPSHWRGQRNCVIPPQRYCRENGLPELESAAIELLCTFTCRQHFDVIDDLIEQIIQRDYGAVPDRGDGSQDGIAGEHATR